MNIWPVLLLQAVVVLVALALYVWYLWALSRLFPHLGLRSRHGWIPFYNEYLLLERAGLSGKWIFTLLIPFIGPLVFWAFRVFAIHRFDEEVGLPETYTIIGAVLPPLWAMQVTEKLNFGVEPLTDDADAPEVSDYADRFLGYLGEGRQPRDVDEPYTGMLPAQQVTLPSEGSSPVATTARDSAPPIPLAASAAPAPVAPVVPGVAVGAAAAEAAHGLPSDALDDGPPVRASYAWPKADRTPVSADADRTPSPDPSAPAVDAASPASAHPAEPKAEPREVPGTSAVSPGYTAVDGQLVGASLPEALEPLRGSQEPDRRNPVDDRLEDTDFDPEGVDPSELIFLPPAPPAPSARPQADGATPENPARRPAGRSAENPPNAFELWERAAEAGAAAAAVPSTPVPAAGSAAVSDAAGSDDDHDDSTIVVERRPNWSVVLPDGTELPLRSQDVVLGRKPLIEAVPGGGEGVTTVTIPDPTRTLSKSHARLRWMHDRWYLEDLGSTNGVMLVSSFGRRTDATPGELIPATERLVLGTLEVRLRRHD